MYIIYNSAIKNVGLRSGL